MTTLAQLIARRDRAEAKAGKERDKYHAANRALHDWANAQLVKALAKRGITPGKSVVRMRVRLTRKGRFVMEDTECLLRQVGQVRPPTMERGALGPNACSSDMWWSATLYWQNIRKDGTPGAWHDYCIVQGDSAKEMAENVHHVRDLE